MFDQRPLKYSPFPVIPEDDDDDGDGVPDDEDNEDTDGDGIPDDSEEIFHLRRK